MEGPQSSSQNVLLFLTAESHKVISHSVQHEARHGVDRAVPEATKRKNRGKVPGGLSKKSLSQKGPGFTQFTQLCLRAHSLETQYRMPRGLGGLGGGDPILVCFF